MNNKKSYQQGLEKTFVLASSSKSRYKILKNCGLFFTKKNPTCDENLYKKKLLKNKISPKNISLKLAQIKCQSVSSILKKKLVVGSDTVIRGPRGLVNKAKNMKDAKAKILSMSGKKIHLYSSASVFFNNKELWNTTQETTIKIRDVNQKEIKKYLKISGKEVLSSAGCFQIEFLGPHIVENIKGDFFNVMGFPLFPFLAFLKEYNQ